MLDKLTGLYAPRPSAGPHKLRESLPLIVFLRNRLKYALNYRETKQIVKSRAIHVDGKIRTDMMYPAGFMGLCLGGGGAVVSSRCTTARVRCPLTPPLFPLSLTLTDVITIPKTGENFRLLYDVKGRYAVHRIKEDEAKYKLCKVRRIGTAGKGIPFAVTHDGRTVRYPDPLVKANDTIKLDLATGRPTAFYKFDTGAQVMVTGGRNTGRVGKILHRDRHPGGFDIVTVEDSAGHQFATRVGNIFVIGQGGSSKPAVTLPRGKGVKLTIAEERDRRLAAKAKQSS